MKKAALNAYLVNNNLDVSGVYGYYEFNTGRKTFLYNNYYSGDQSPVLFSITGLFVLYVKIIVLSFLSIRLVIKLMYFSVNLL